MRPMLRTKGAWAVAVALAAPALARAQADAPEPARAAAPAPRAPRAAAAAAAEPRRGAGPAVVAPKPEDDPEKAEKVEKILAKWEGVSAGITQLDATFRRVDLKTGAFKGRLDFEGRALLKAPNLACLDVKKVDPEDRTKKTFHERILCTGAEVVQYDGEAHLINVYPLPKEDRQRALQEGPLPFLFNMKAAQVKKRYHIFLMDEGAAAYRLKIIPLEDIDRDAFSLAVMDLNKKTFLPDVLQLHSPNGKERQTYYFTGPGLALKPNAPIEPRNFQMEKNPKWKVVVNPERGAAPADKGVAEQPDAEARQPAAMQPKRPRFRTR